MTNQGEWLPLLNYSTKHGVSLSTLRRRIKSNTIEYKLEGGKYFLLDERAPRKNSIQSQAAVASPETKAVPVPAERKEIPLNQDLGLSSSFVEASILSSANRLVEEIKAAYAKILQEKEEQIALLKEETVDLRMLVRILEEGVNKKPPAGPVETETFTEGSSTEEFLFGDYQNREI